MGQGRRQFTDEFKREVEIVEHRYGRGAPLRFANPSPP